MKAQLIGLVAAGVVVIAGCGGSNEPIAGATSTTPSVTVAEPTPIETDTCRSTVGPLLELFDVMRTEASTGGMTQSSFAERFERLQAGQDDVTANCTNTVGQPFAKAMYDMALVNAAMLNCDTAAACEKAGVPEHMQNALDEQSAIEAALSATR